MADLAVDDARRNFSDGEGDGLGELELQEHKGILGFLEQAPDPETCLVEALRARILVQAPEGSGAAEVPAFAIHFNGSLREEVSSKCCTKEAVSCNLIT